MSRSLRKGRKTEEKKAYQNRTSYLP
jgi:hypothetical protein